MAWSEVEEVVGGRGSESSLMGLVMMARLDGGSLLALGNDLEKPSATKSRDLRSVMSESLQF